MRIAHGSGGVMAKAPESVERKVVYPSTIKRHDKVEGEQIQLIHRGQFFDVSHIYVAVNGVPAELQGIPTRLRKHNWQRALSTELRRKGLRVENLFNSVRTAYK